MRAIGRKNLIVKQSGVWEHSERIVGEPCVNIRKRLLETLDDKHGVNLRFCE